MRKRNVAILFRLNRKEAEALDKKVKKSGLSRAARPQEGAADQARWERGIHDG